MKLSCRWKELREPVECSPLIPAESGGNVWAWGWGKGGQLGTGRQAESLIPVEADSGAVMISSTASDVVVAS